MGHVLHRCGVGAYGVLALVIWVVGASDARAAPVCFLHNENLTYIRGSYSDQSEALGACEAEYDQRGETGCVGHSGCTWQQEDQSYKMVLRNPWGFSFIHLYPVNTCPSSGTLHGADKSWVARHGSEWCVESSSCVVVATYDEPAVVQHSETLKYYEGGWYSLHFTGERCSGEPAMDLSPKGFLGEPDPPETCPEDLNPGDPDCAAGNEDPPPEDPPPEDPPPEDPPPEEPPPDKPDVPTCPPNFSWDGESCAASQTSETQQAPPVQNPDGSVSQTTSATQTNPDGSQTTTTTTTTTKPDGSQSTTSTTTTVRPPGTAPGSGDANGDGYCDPASEECGEENPGPAQLPGFDDVRSIGESMGALMTGVQNAPIVAALRNVVIPSHGGGACPGLSLDFFGQTVATDVHCQFAASVAGMLTALMLGVYVLIGVRIVASA